MFLSAVVRSCYLNSRQAASLLGLSSGVVTGLTKTERAHKFCVVPLGGFYSPSVAERHFLRQQRRGLGVFAASPVFTPLGGIWYRLIVRMETLQATSLHFSFCHSAVMLSEQPSSVAVTGLAKTESAHKFRVVPLGGVLWVFARKQRFEELAGVALRVGGNLFRCADGDDFPAAAAAFRA